MNRFLIALAALLATFACASFAGTPLPPTPATGWCGDSLTPAGWDGVRDCANQPPPPADPGAYTTAMVTWIVYPPLPAVNTDVTQLFNLFGRINQLQPIQGWPGVSGATIRMADTSSRYYRMRFHMPSNPGTLSHFLKATSYGATPGLRAKFALVRAGGAWPTGAATPCWKPSEPFSDQVVLNINPGAPNPSKCSAPPGGDYDVLTDALTNGTVALTIN